MTALDTSWSIEKLGFLFKGSAWFFLHFSPISLDKKCLFLFPNTSFSLQTSFLRDFWPSLIFLPLVWFYFSHFIMHFIPFDLTFGIFDKRWGFSKFWGVCKIFGMGFYSNGLNHHALHHICILTMIHAFRCMINMLKWCALVGLDWAKPMM